MRSCPGYDEERLEATLVRVELLESRALVAGDLHHAVHHLLKGASVACLLGREGQAGALAQRAAGRMLDWLESVRIGRLRTSSYTDLAATRGLLALALMPEVDVVGSAGKRAAFTFLRQTEEAPPGGIQNARMVAAALLEEWEELEAAAPLIDRTDEGLGLPWRRFGLGLAGHDDAEMEAAAGQWLREKREATNTLEWGPYNEVPIEVSAALALAELSGHRLRIASEGILSRFWPG